MVLLKLVAKVVLLKLVAKVVLLQLAAVTGSCYSGAAKVSC